ncbi:peptidylprolyl isomerase [Bifidobacterium leontopitheci]|nr:peptidylprolyl isomerase [Bifidobacterium leontopitheci]
MTQSQQHRGLRPLAIVVAAVAVVTIVVAVALVMTQRNAASKPTTTQTTAFPTVKFGTTVVTEAEFRQALKTQRTAAVSHFKQQYDVDLNDEDADWTKTYGSGDERTTPVAWLVRQTVETLRTRHAAYLVGESIGDVPNDSYDAIVARMNAANKANARKRSDGKIVYGRSTYDIDVYLDYELTALKNSYIDNSENPGMTLTDADVQAYYDAHDWTVEGVDGKAPLADVKANVKVQLREERYREIVAKKAATIDVSGLPWKRLTAYTRAWLG